MIFRDKKDAEDMAELVLRVAHLEAEIRTLRDAMFHFLKGQHKLRDDFDKHIETHSGFGLMLSQIKWMDKIEAEYNEKCWLRRVSGSIWSEF